MTKKIAIVFLLVVSVFVAKRTYFEPRYGGIVGFFNEGSMAGSVMKQVESLHLARFRSILSVYFGDHDGKYPTSLEVLWEGNNYLSGPVPHADIFVETKNGNFSRAHWYRDTNWIKNFPSRASADDAGGWGYVNDPQSKEYGTVFVNCTHLHWTKGIPWNISDVQPDGKADRKQ